MHKFCKKKGKLFAYNPSKEIWTFLVFLNYTSGYLKLWKIVCMLKWRGTGLFKKLNFINFWTFVFYKLFYFIAGFCHLQFFAYSKSRAKSSNDVSIVIMWTSNMGSRGGGGSNFPPPQRFLVFKFPIRYRVKWFAT